MQHSIEGEMFCAAAAEIGSLGLWPRQCPRQEIFRSHGQGNFSWLSKVRLQSRTELRFGGRAAQNVDANPCQKLPQEFRHGLRGAIPLPPLEATGAKAQQHFETHHSRTPEKRG